MFTHAIEDKINKLYKSMNRCINQGDLKKAADYAELIVPLEHCVKIRRAPYIWGSTHEFTPIYPYGWRW